MAPIPVQTLRRDQAGRYVIISRLFEPPAPPAGPPVVLVHGLSMSSLYFEPTGLELAKAGLRVYAPDLPGYGRSDEPDRSLNLDELAAALERWLDELSIGPAAFIGNSLGCNVLVNLALRCPGRVGKLVLIGPTLDPWARSYPRVVARAAWNMFFEPLSFWKIILRDYLASGLRRTVVTLGYGLHDPLEEKLPSVGAPTLVVRGANDRIISDRWARQVAKLLPHGQHLTLPGAAHVLNYSHPVRLSAALLPFLTP